MLKRTCLAALTALLLSVAEVSALPVGNPLDATWLCDGLFWEGNCCDPCDPSLRWCDAWSIRFGFYGDYVFNRYMEVNQRHQDSDIRDTKIYTNAAYAAFNLYNRFEIFGTLGKSQIHIETPGSAFFLSDTRTNLLTTIDSEWYLSWSVGARATLWECGCFGVGAEAQYFRTSPHLKYFDLQIIEPFYLDNARVGYREYQAGLGATYTIPIAGCATFVVPYVAVKWAHATLNMGDFRLSILTANFELYDLESKHSTGAAIGITLVGCQRWSFTAEARFGDELALHINSQVRF